MHPSEIAHTYREIAWNRELSIPTVPPNTSKEYEALQELDHSRREETAALRKRAHPARMMR